MSLQDDIFDIEAALEGKPEAKLFDNFVKRFGELETRLHNPPQEVEYSSIEFYWQAGPPDLMHHSIQMKIESGWHMVQMLSWDAAGGDARVGDKHWRVIFVRKKR